MIVVFLVGTDFEITFEVVVGFEVIAVFSGLTFEESEVLVEACTGICGTTAISCCNLIEIDGEENSKLRAVNFSQPSLSVRRARRKEARSVHQKRDRQVGESGKGGRGAHRVILGSVAE